MTIEQNEEQELYRVDIISDTHGYLSKELVSNLKGTDLIVHAGDMCSKEDLEFLKRIAPVQACLGNNDYASDYNNEIDRINHFIFEGVRFQVSHYKERLVWGSADVYVCGHTHRPVIENITYESVLVNPGSPTYPRTMFGPTMARLFIQKGKVTEIEIIEL